MAVKTQYVHVSSVGRVLGLTNSGGVPRELAVDVTTFSPCEAVSLRVLGCPANYRLLSSLSWWRAGGVLVGRPPAFSVTWSPGFLLSWMVVTLPSDPLFPVWAELTTVDSATYRLLAANAEKLSEDHRQQCFEQHPMFPCFQFLSEKPGDDWCQLLMTIVDPRWFVTWSRPERTVRLQRYFGLDEEPSGWPKKDRFELLRRCALQTVWPGVASQSVVGRREMRQVLQFVVRYWLGLQRVDPPFGSLFDSETLPPSAVSKLKEMFNA